MSTVKDRGDSRAKQKAHDLIARHLLFLMKKANIPEETLEVVEKDIISLLEPEWSMCPIDVTAVVGYIASLHKTWARNGSYVVIEGGGPFDEAKRDKVMNYCLLKAILANFNETVVESEEVTSLGEVTRQFVGTVAKVFDFQSVMPYFTSWKNERIDLLNEWVKPPVLAIREIDPNRGPRLNSDAAPLLDSILRQRRMAKKTTILTFIGSTAEMRGGVKKGGSTHGVELTNIVGAMHNKEIGIIRMMLGGKQ